MELQLGKSESESYSNENEFLTGHITGTGTSTSDTDQCYTKDSARKTLLKQRLENSVKTVNKWNN